MVFNSVSKINIIRISIQRVLSMSEDDLIRVRGIGPTAASRLNKAGIKTIEELANATAPDLAFVKGIGIISAKKIIANANHLLTLERGLTIVLDKIRENFSKSCPKCGSELKERYIIIDPRRRLHVLQCTVCKFYLPA